jgi:hypothetical protein
MGRSANSFTTWVGHALEINNDRVDLPEKDLWVAVLCRAALDACKGPPHLNMKLPCNISHKNYYDYNREAARHFFLEGGPHFRNICEMAGRNPYYVREKISQILLGKKSWNEDIPITSHYRQGPKRGKRKYRKKHLTGNAYYAAKAAKGPKNFYYQDMGKKGGRPRIYNRIT